MDRIDILDSAKTIVTGREQQHGDVESSFARIAQMWAAYLDRRITAQDVCAMMILLKAARIASGHQNDDNWVDIAGYAACGGGMDDV